MPNDSREQAAGLGWQPLGQACTRPLDPGEFLRVAAACTEAVARWHAAHLAHGGVDADTLQLAPDREQARLLPPGPPSLSCLAPEQSTRLQRRLDPRSDCYALGVLFYRLLTGVLPFDADDPLAWLHAHAARIPAPPHRIHPAVPLALSEIVMKMLAKAPEQRYQRLAALQDDLAACARQWQARQRIERFAIGASDRPVRLQSPQRLAGRAEQLAALCAAYEDLRQQAAPALVLITGHAGVGKSALVAEFEKAVLGHGGIFLAGKFDPVRRHVPYATLSDALRQLFHTLAAGGAAARLSWRAQLAQALDGQAAVLYELVPPLRALLGGAGGPTELADLGADSAPTQAAQRRLFAALRALLCALARGADGLVLFFDDLHWADPASLAFLDYLLVEEAAPRVLVVGAYRDSETSVSHPLQLALARLERVALARRTLYLAPLGAGHVAEMLAELLHAAPERVAALAALVQRKTGGNALFVLQFLRRLEQSGLLGFDAGRGQWRWNLEAIRKQGYTDNVVELMIDNLRRTLSERTLLMLRHAACLGQCGALSVLAGLDGCAPDDAGLRGALQEAADAGIVELADQDSLRFCHDRFQQALYAMLAPAAREQLHLRAARLLEQRGGGAPFDVADHYNLGAAGVETAEERRRIAELNLAAGRRAKAAGAYASAAHYLANGMRQLGAEAFATDAALAFTLGLERATCEFLNANGAHARQLIGVLLQHTPAEGRRLHDRVRVLTLQIEVLSAAGRYRDALVALSHCAALLDTPLDLDPDPAALQAQAGAVRALLDGQPATRLLELPALADPSRRCLMHALATALPAAFVMGRPVIATLTLHLVELTLRHGLCGASAMGLVNYAAICCLPEERFADAARFEALALEVGARHGDAATRAAVHFVAGQFVSPVTGPLRAGLEHLRRAFDEARASGNLSFACFCSYAIVARRHSQGDALPALLEDIDARLDFVQRTAVQDVRSNLLVWRRYVAALAAPGAASGAEGGDALAEPAFAAELAAQAHSPALFVYHLLTLQLRYLLGDYGAALAAADAAQAGAHTASITQSAELRLFHALALSAAQDAEGGTDAAVTAAHDWFARMAAHCPDNFGAGRLLLEGELARRAGRHADAVKAFGGALEHAQGQGQVQLAALAWELAAGCHRQHGWNEHAAAALDAAARLYGRWGAHAKLARLRALQPAAGLHAEVGAPLQIDLLAVAKAAQQISGEVSSERLHEGLLRVVLEHAGAQSARLLLMHDGQPRMEAMAELRPDGFQARSLRALPLDAGALPHSIIHYVLRTRAPLVLADACQDARFAQDAYLSTRLQCSVLCLPIERRQALSGVLYAENVDLPNAFAHVSLDVLELLVSQAAISLENAGLVEHLQQSQQLLSAVMDNVPACVYVKDLDGRYLYVNRATEQLLGIDLAQVLGKTDADVFPSESDEPRAVTEADQRVIREGRPLTFEENLVLPTGQLRSFLTVKAPLYREHGVHGICGISTDVSEQRRARERIEYLARYDALTGLPNRTLLIDRLDVAIAGARRHGGALAVLYLDLDRFKAVNDSLGHWAGDLLLKEAAGRLRAEVREADTVARLAGDEFMVLLAEVDQPAHARQRADRLVAALGAPFLLDGHQVSIGASVGISLYPADALEAETLIKHADMAMYHAKQAGRGQCQFFDAAMNLRAQERLSLENQLRGALAKGELFILYQPQLDLKERRIGGAEALLRWRHPGHGLVPPSKFIPIAEDCGLIPEITRWVIGQVCRQMRCWRDAGICLRSLAVNISALSLAEDGLCEDVAAALAAHRLQGDCLELEMTEGILMRDVDASIVKLHQLKRMGVRLAIDDFGTGYSSLSYLKRLPVDKLKIDQSFVRDIAHDPNDSAITSTIIAMARHLNLKVIAEGVEDAAAERFLCEQQCDQMQGYLVGRPVSAEALEAMLVA